MQIFFVEIAKASNIYLFFDENKLNAFHL